MLLAQHLGAQTTNRLPYGRLGFDPDHHECYQLGGVRSVLAKPHTIAQLRGGVGSLREWMGAPSEGDPAPATDQRGGKCFEAFPPHFGPPSAFLLRQALRL